MTTFEDVKLRLAAALNMLGGVHVAGYQNVRNMDGAMTILYEIAAIHQLDIPTGDAAE